MKIGIAVECALCRRTKAPHGRSITPETWNSYCQSYNCIGYSAEPESGCLFPGEVTEDDDPHFCSRATRQLTEAEIVARSEAGND